MASFNQFNVMGNLTNDPEVKYLASGSAVCNFDIATNHVYVNKQTNEKKEEVTYIPCTAFGRTAEIVGEYCGKGKPVLLSGRIRQESWEDKATGQKRSKLGLIVETLVLLGSKPDGQPRQPREQSGGHSEAPAASGSDAFDDTDSVPF